MYFIWGKKGICVHETISEKGALSVILESSTKLGIIWAELPAWLGVGEGASFREGGGLSVGT